MTKFEFSLLLQASSEKLLTLAIDYEKYVEYLPAQIRQVKIIEKTSKYTITEETLFFKTVIKNEIIQSSKHIQNSSNHLISEIISGPFEGSTINVIYEQTDSGTKVSVSADIKIPIKYKILTLMIKKVYKMWLTSVLYKMNSIALGYSK